MQDDRPPLMPRDRYKNDAEYREARRAHYGVTQEEEQQRIDKKASDKEKYTQGVYCEELDTQYGKFTKVSIQVDKFMTNDTTTKGYVNFIIKRSRSGRLYAENVKY